MGAEFTAYIDESGDPGFSFGPLTRAGNGSSYWLFVGAVVTRNDHESGLLNAMREVRRLGGFEPYRKFHFHKETHEERVAVLRALARQRVQVIAVGLNKKELPVNSESPLRKEVFNRTMAFLIERVSWLCRDSARSSSKVTLKFAQRRGILAPIIQGQVTGLVGHPDYNIHWPSVNIPDIEVHPAQSLLGLQMADHVASGARYSIEPDRFGNIEPLYIRLMRPVFYRYLRSGGDRVLNNYGLKLWPRSFEQMKRAGYFDECPPLSK